MKVLLILILDGSVVVEQKRCNGSAICYNPYCPGPRVMGRDGNSAALMGVVLLTGSMGLLMNQYQQRISKNVNLDAIVKNLSKLRESLYVGDFSSLPGDL